MFTQNFTQSNLVHTDGWMAKEGGTFQTDKVICKRRFAPIQLDMQEQSCDEKMYF